MTPRLTCPNARYVDGMRVYCDKIKGFCGNVFFKACRGWWALNANAARCPIRKGGVSNGGTEVPADHNDAF